MNKAPDSVGYTVLNSIALESNSGGVTVESVGHLLARRTLEEGSSSSQSQPAQTAMVNTSCQGGGGSYQNTSIKQEYPSKSIHLAKKNDLVMLGRGSGPQEMLRWRRNSVCSSQQHQVETVNTFSSSSLPMIESYGQHDDVHYSGGHENINIVAQRRWDSGAVFPDAKLQHGPTYSVSEQTAHTTSTPQYSRNCSGVKQSQSVDSSAHKSPTNSIEWQHDAYQLLQVLKEKYRKELKNLHYRTKERCLQPSSSAEERSKLENGARVVEMIYAFLSMPKALLANYPKENFVHNTKHIIGSLNNPRLKLASARPISQTSNHLNPSTQQQLGQGIKLNTSRQQGSGSRHVGGHELQCKNTSGLGFTENKPPMENMNILPIFNAQSNGQQEAFSLLPQPAGMDCLSTQWKVELSSRKTESASNSIMSANPITNLSPPSVGKQKKRQMMKPPKVMPHPILTNNLEKISARGTKRSNLEPAVERRNHPVGQDRQNSPSSQGGLANCNVSSVSALLNHPQHMNPNGSSKQSQTSASLASVPSSPPCSFAPSCNGEYHVDSSSPESQHAHTKNTDGTRDVSHQNDDIHETEVVPCPVSVAKRQKTEVAKLVFQEIKTINRRLIETVVDVKDRMTDATHGGEGVILQFTFSAAGQKRSPNLMHDPLLMLPDLLLQVVVSADYPNLSPCIVDRNLQPWSENGLAMWNETWQKFDRAVRKLVQPISLIEMAKAWDASAHEACCEYAHKLGGGCFSSKYGTWEKCIV